MGWDMNVFSTSANQGLQGQGLFKFAYNTEEIHLLIEEAEDGNFLL